MTKEKYERLSAPFRDNKKKQRRLVLANRVITAAFYVAYILLIIVLAVMRDPRIIRVVLVPLVSFVAVSVFRRILNTKRPYELWDIAPLIDRKGRGCSFPSRHIFSIFIIAMAMSWICLPAAIIMMVAGVALSFIRVIAGVHFPRDVIAGAAIGSAVGIIFFWIL